MLHRLGRSVHRVGTGLSPLSSRTGLTVQHDRDRQRFTVTPGTGAGECAVLTYRFLGPSEVDLMSTFVPEEFRGQGVAALLSQAALDFLVEDHLRARVSCWYINKFLEDGPQQNLRDLIIT